MARSTIGLDIGTRAVRLAEVVGSSGKPVVSRFGRILLPVGAVEHGEVHEPEVVGRAIATLWKRLGLTGRSVHVGVSNRRVVVRVIELPVMSPDDLASAIRFQAQEHIPIPLDEAVMDFEVLEEAQGSEGQPVQRVLVVAAERSTVEAIIQAVRAANLEPATLELNAYPLVRTFANGSSGAQAIVDVGAGVTNVVIHENGKIAFTRLLPTFGGDDFTLAVAQGLGVSRDEAESLKRKAFKVLKEHAKQPASMALAAAVGSHQPSGPVAPSAPMGPRPVAPSAPSAPSVSLAEELEQLESSLSSDDLEDHEEDLGRDAAVGHDEVPGSYESQAAASPISSPMRSFVPASQAPRKKSPEEVAAGIIEPLLDRFISEVRGSIEYYTSQPEAPQIEKVVLTGGGALMGGIAERLNAALGVQVESGHPFDRVPVGKVQISDEERKVAEPFMSVAIGLALARGA